MSRLRLRRRSRQLSRKDNGSKSYARASLRLARLHRRVKNIRQTRRSRHKRKAFMLSFHKVTTQLAKTKPVIVVEDLAVRGLGQGRLSRSVAFLT